jgi:hypothetical protein
VYPGTYGMAEAERYARGLSSADKAIGPYASFERSLAQAVVDPKTGKTAIYQSGKIPIITRNVTIPESIPKVGGKTIAYNLPLYGKTYPLGSLQSIYDMWAEVNHLQVTWDIQVHYLQNLSEFTETQLINKVLDDAGGLLKGIKAWKSQTIDEIQRTMRADAYFSPEAVRSNANITTFELQRRNMTRLLNKEVYPNAGQVDRITKNTTSEWILNGKINSKNVDEMLELLKADARERALISFDPQIKILKEEADAFIGSGAPANVYDFISDMNNISSIIKATEDRIPYFRSMTELRSHSLAGKDIDDFHVGSAKLLAEYMDVSQKEIERMLTQLEKNVASVKLTPTQLKNFTSMQTSMRLKISQLIDTRLKIAQVESEIGKTAARSRNKKFWDSQKVRKEKIWNEYFTQYQITEEMYQNAARRFLTSDRKSVYVPNKLPDVSKGLTPSHISYLFGITGDDVYRGLTQPLSAQLIVRPKDSFTTYVRVQADALASKFNKTADDIGFTREAIGEVYDQLWRNLGIEPTILTPDHPTITQIDSIGSELHRLFASNSLSEGDAAIWSKYVNQIADDLEKLPMYSNVPKQDVGLAERIATPKEIEAHKVELERLTKVYKSKTDAENIIGKTLKGEYLVDNDNKIKIRQEVTDLAQKVPVQPKTRSYSYVAEEISKNKRMMDFFGVDASSVGKKSPSEMLGFFSSQKRAGSIPDDINKLIDSYTTEINNTGLDATNLGELMNKWFQKSDNNDLQEIGRTASKDKVYLEGIHKILKEQYPSGYIRIFRGSGQAKSKALEREFTNVTSSRRTALDFENTWDVPATWGSEGLIPPKGGPDIDNILVKVDDVVSIGAVDESELIIPAEVLKDRISKPIILPYTSEGWYKTKEAAMSTAREQHALSFPTYNDSNVIDETMRNIFPFWNYELFRWRWLPRTAMRTPGVFTNIARYMDYTDGGYTPVPFTDLEVNIFRSSIFMGGLASLYHKDYPEYYDQFPMTKLLDIVQRAGFYPGTIFQLPIVMYGTGGEGRVQWGELAPPWITTPLYALTAISPDHIGKLTDLLLPDRFRDYQTMLMLGKWGYDADYIWKKKQSGTPLSDAEDKLWNKAMAEATGITGVIMEQMGVFRLKPEEYKQAQQELMLAIQDATGVSVKIQEQINRNYPVTGKRFSDIYPAMDTATRKLVYMSESYRRWRGVSTPLMPSSYQDMEVKISNYYDEVNTISDNARHLGILDSNGNLAYESIDTINQQFISGIINASQWKSARDSILTQVQSQISALANSETYKDVPKTLDEKAVWAATKGSAPYTLSPEDELLNYYYSLQPELKWNDESGKNEYDYDTYYAYVDNLLNSLTTEVKDRLLSSIQLKWTYLEKLYWKVSREFIKPYRRIRDIVLSEYTSEEQYLINSYGSADVERRNELELLADSKGEALISGFNSKVRQARINYRRLDPELDAWLNFFGSTDSFITQQAQDIYATLKSQYLVQ